MVEQRNPYYKGNPEPKIVEAKYKEPFRKRFGKGAKAFGRGVLSTTKTTGKGVLKVGRVATKGVAKGSQAAYSGVAKTYRGIGRAESIHRGRVLEKELYRTKRLEQRVVRHGLKQQLPEKPVSRSPLKDPYLRREAKKGAFFNGGPKVKVGGPSKRGPLSDAGYSIKKKGKRKGGFFA